MKSKIYRNKLILNKKTIAHLGNNEIEVVYGGRDTLTTICNTRCASECTTCQETCRLC
jgi:hypothetical protein